MTLIPRGAGERIRKRYDNDDGREPIVKTKETTIMTAEQELEKLARARAERTGETYEKAEAAVLDTPEGSALYSKSLREASPEITKSDDEDEAEQVAKAITAKRERRAETLTKLHAGEDAVDVHYNSIAKRIRRDGESEADAYIRAMREFPEAWNAKEARRAQLLGALG